MGLGLMGLRVGVWGIRMKACPWFGAVKGKPERYEVL